MSDVPEDIRSTPASPQKSSGWEKADKVAAGAGAVASGIGWMILKLYALALIAGGIAIMIHLSGGSAFIGLVLIGYGIYLIAPGSKFVVY